MMTEVENKFPLHCVRQGHFDDITWQACNNVLISEIHVRTCQNHSKPIKDSYVIFNEFYPHKKFVKPGKCLTVLQ